MEQYFAECTWCDWESAAADTQAAAAALGIDHSGAVHAGADSNAAMGALRVRYYFTVTAPPRVQSETGATPGEESPEEA